LFYIHGEAREQNGSKKIHKQRANWGKSKTENGIYASTAIMAGHTTGGEKGNSDEVTAIPLKKRNGNQ